VENLELEGYLKKGLLPERLLTAEHTSGRLAQVRCSSGGVHVVDGNVMNAVDYLTQMRRPRLRAAWLDFDGNPHTFVEELLSIARVLPSPQGGALGITGFAARDQGALRQGTINTSKFYSGLPNTGLFLRQYGRMMGQYDHLMRHIARGRSTALSHFQREMGLLWWLVLMFGVTHLPQGEPYYELDRNWIRRADKVLGEIKCDVERLLGTQARETDLVFVLNRALRELLQDRHVEIAFWSVNRQPMRSWFVKVQPWPHDEIRPTMQDLLDQVWTLACSSPLVYIDEAGETVTIG
jgi:hypothetical protein